MALLLGIALCGCAAVVIPTQVRFPTLKPGSDPLPMRDTRPSEAREYREQGRDPVQTFLADDDMRPNPVDLVASRIADALPESHRGRAIELRRLDIGFLVSPRSLLPTSTGTSISAQSGTAASAIVAGVLLGYGIIAALAGARADESGVAYIEVWIGADSLRSAQSVTIARNVGAAQAVETAFAAALDDLASQARGLGSREPGTR